MLISVYVVVLTDWRWCIVLIADLADSDIVQEDLLIQEIIESNSQLTDLLTVVRNQHKELQDNLERYELKNNPVLYPLIIRISFTIVLLKCKDGHIDNYYDSS